MLFSPAQPQKIDLIPIAKCGRGSEHGVPIRRRDAAVAGVGSVPAGLLPREVLVEKNSLKVTAPDDLKGTYECAIGNFGVPQYGGTMVGFVAYPKANRKTCKSFDDFDISYKAKPGAFPTFLLVDKTGEVSKITRLLLLLATVVVPLGLC